MSMRWLGIVRLGLVQAALGSVVVLVTSTLNRVMVVEYALPAMLPGMLVALHYAVQMIRPRFGHGSDLGARRTPWVIGGMAVLSAGGVVCALATVAMAGHSVAAMALAVLGYTMVGLGVGAAGTSLLVVLAKQVDARRRAAAAAIMWVLMIAGFAITSTTVGHYLDPFSPRRLITVVGAAAVIAFVLAVLAIWKVERSDGATPHAGAEPGRAATTLRAPPKVNASFSAALRGVWADTQARRFTLFVFVSMLAYSAEELLLEPFCGLVFGQTIGQSAKLSGLWHSAVFIGMICAGILCSGSRRAGSLRAWTVGGCCASAVAISSLAVAGIVGPGWPIKASVVMLGVANGVFAVSAIGSMMELAHQNEAGGAGVRMGVWGAAQALAFALGGVVGTGGVDLIRHVSGSPGMAFAIVFGMQGILFFSAARFAARVGSTNVSLSAANPTTAVIA
jgi:BCD family chlorophyll transporter-like MFS transporter